MSNRDPAVNVTVQAAAVAGLPAHDCSKSGKPDIAWDEKGARDELVSRLVTDAQYKMIASLALVAG